MSILYIYTYNKYKFETTIPDVNQHHNAPVHLDSLRNRASLYNTGQANSSRHIVVIHAHGNTDDVTTQCRDARSEVVNNLALLFIVLTLEGDRL